MTNASLHRHGTRTAGATDSVKHEVGSAPCLKHRISGQTHAAIWGGWERGDGEAAAAAAGGSGSAGRGGHGRRDQERPGRTGLRAERPQTPQTPISAPGSLRRQPGHPRPHTPDPAAPCPARSLRCPLPGHSPSLESRLDMHQAKKRMAQMKPSCCSSISRLLRTFLSTGSAVFGGASGGSMRARGGRRGAGGAQRGSGLPAARGRLHGGRRRWGEAAARRLGEAGSGRWRREGGRRRRLRREAAARRRPQGPGRAPRPARPAAAGGGGSGAAAAPLPAPGGGGIQAAPARPDGSEVSPLLPSEKERSGQRAPGPSAPARPSPPRLSPATFRVLPGRPWQRASPRG